MDTQITTFIIFDFKTRSDKWFAFTQMGFFPWAVGKVEGLVALKLMGSGADNGFGMKPNFSRYCLLAIWANEASAEAFFEQNKTFKNYAARASGQQTIFLKNTMAHGSWGGANPFKIGAVHDKSQPVAVITRATIKWKDMVRFWRDVPSVSQNLKEHKGLIFAIGVGELPARFQATFSIWQSGEDMLQYAYKAHQHKAIVQKTKETQWYKEELFARFVPYKQLGDNNLA
jgi:hypothetical protein